MSDQAVNAIAQTTLLKRLADLKEIAREIAFVASDEAAHRHDRIRMAQSRPNPRGRATGPLTSMTAPRRVA